MSLYTPYISKNFISREDSDVAPEPCLLCDVLDDSLRGVRGHIDSVRDRENEVGLDLPDITDNDEPDVNNSTHTTQVCSNWYVVYIKIFLTYSRFLMMDLLSISTKQQ